MCHWINRTCLVLPIDIHYMDPYRAPEKCIILYYIARIISNVYKGLGINSAILLHLYCNDAKSKVFKFKFIFIRFIKNENLHKT